MGTRYDCRNDPSWHAKGSQLFSVAAIITNGDESVEVSSFDQLGVKDKSGNLVNQNFLDEHLGFLNGKTLIGTYSSKSTVGRVNQGQRALTRLKNKMDQYGHQPFNMLEARDRRRILDNFDRQFMQVWFSMMNLVFKNEIIIDCLF